MNSANTSPKDIVTDGLYLWVVNDSTTDKVFKYTVAGALVGSWTIGTSGASSPTGITIDPTNVNNVWIVDSGTARVYQYDDAAGIPSGTLTASTSFALSAGNTNPQGIADPPPPSATLTSASTIVANNDDAAKSVALVGVGAVPMHWFGPLASNVSSTRLPRVETTARNTDEIMSNLGTVLQIPEASASPARRTFVVSRKAIDPSERDDFEIEDEIVSELIGFVANNLRN